MDNSLKVISLFTGAGGIELGLEAAGYETSVALEMEKACCQTVNSNRDWPLIDKDISEVSSGEILEKGGLRPGGAALLAGGPPCQPFSKSSYWVKGDSMRMKDPRAKTLHHYLRVLEDTMPEAFILENVFGLAYKGKDEGYNFLLSQIEEINRKHNVRYRVSSAILNAADYGVPQIRERVFIVGHIGGKRFNFPPPTHYNPLKAQLSIGDDKRIPYRTAWDAIGDLNDEVFPDENLHITGKWAELLPSIPEGNNYLWHTDRMGGKPLFGWRTRYWSFLLKLAKSRPSWTIQAQPGSAIGPFHWKNRRLSNLELCRLMTFPEDYRISGGRGSVQSQLGNAVPSLIAEILGREIASQFFGIKNNSKPLKLEVPLRTPVPDPEKVQPVPKKYLHLVGDHAPHPGTGKGRKAKKATAASP
jgi:DNA (cytosine-5)-methyltransferase 1